MDSLPRSEWSNPIQREGSPQVATSTTRFKDFHESLTKYGREPGAFRKAWGPMQSMLESGLLDHQSTRHSYQAPSKKYKNRDRLPRIRSIVSSVAEV